MFLTSLKSDSEKAPELLSKMSTGETSTDLAVISVQSRLPDFWAEMPRLWFAQVESVLSPQKQSDEAKFNMVIAKLGRDALQQVSDILLSPPTTDKFKAIKDRLLHVYEESAERQFQKLVSEMELGAQKPSQLLRKMREMGRNAQISEQALHSLWTSRLSSSIRAVLLVSQDQTLENLANIADKIMENVGSAMIAEVNTKNTAMCSEAAFPVTEILSQMHKLNLEVAALREEVSTHRRAATRGRGSFRGRQRSRSRSRTPADPDWLCPQHFRYRSRARGCRQPCAWRNKDMTTPGN